MTWVVRLSDDYTRMGTCMLIAQEGEGGYRAIFGPDLIFHTPPEPGLDIPHEWLWYFPFEAMPEIFTALNKHLGGIDNPKTLRDDLLHERARVDKMMSAMVEKYLR